jgi:hypothetical protein
MFPSQPYGRMTFVNQISFMFVMVLRFPTVDVAHFKHELLPCHATDAITLPRT